MPRHFKIKIHFLKLDEEGLHLFVKAKINGKNCNMLVDTGASKTVMDKNFLKKKFPKLIAEKSEHISSGLGTNTMRIEMVKIKTLKLGEKKIPDHEFAVIDLHHVNSMYEAHGFPQIEAILGSDLLLENKAVIDYGKKLLTLA